MSSDAVVLFSGGMDSAVTLAECLITGQTPHLLCIHYGQRHVAELKAAAALAAHYELGLHTYTLLPTLWEEASSLVGKYQQLPTEDAKQVPSTYVPMRNAIFLALAAAYAESIGSASIWVGVNYNDQNGIPSPDGREVFIRAMELALMLGSKCGVEGRNIHIETPLITLSKAGVIERGIELGVPLRLTRSCFSGETKSCGKCGACVTRAKGFAELGILDPAP